MAAPRGDAARARHMHNFWKLPSDPSRCDNAQQAAGAARTTVPLITAPATPTSDPIIRIARKHAWTWQDERVARACYTITETTASTHEARDMTLLQDRWQAYLQAVAGVASTDFWALFLALHDQSTVAIDSALHAVKRVFVDVSDRKRFPISRRQLATEMKKIGPFWQHVMHEVTIDVSHFQLPSGTKSIQFSFVDPIWGWLVAARRQNAKELHWRPVAQRRGHEVYGGGIQYGKFFATAYASLPAGADVMCIGLHWDGTGAFGLDGAPICVCVGNSNSSKADTQYCIAYIPHLPDSRKPEWKKHPKSTEVKFYIRQQCAAAILRVIEEAATRGVKCRLLNQHNDEVVRMLYARLSSMNFDQPEAQLFFGLANKCSCSKCRRRLGYSAFRRNGTHDPREILRLYDVANDVTETGENRLRARERLHRWGFKSIRKCCLWDVCDRMLVRIPGHLELFPSVDYRDRLHGLIIFVHRILFTFFNDCWTSKNHRQVLDRRLHAVNKRRFRHDGQGVRCPKTIFAETHMTSQDRVIVIFLLSHVIGPGYDDIIDEAMYMPLATAIATAQVMFIAARGHRSYTETEWDIIFNRGYLMFFGALDSARDLIYRKRLRTWATSPSGNAPKRFKPQNRYTVVGRNENALNRW